MPRTLLWRLPGRRDGIQDVLEVVRRSDLRRSFVRLGSDSAFHIKSIRDGGRFQYHGIKHQSTISPTGHNLAIFDSARLRCVSSSVVEVRDLQYTVALV